jgi:hypothetical protein
MCAVGLLFIRSNVACFWRLAMGASMGKRNIRQKRQQNQPGQRTALPAAADRAPVRWFGPDAPKCRHGAGRASEALKPWRLWILQRRLICQVAVRAKMAHLAPAGSARRLQIWSHRPAPSHAARNFISRRLFPRNGFFGCSGRGLRGEGSLSFGSAPPGKRYPIRSIVAVLCFCAVSNFKGLWLPCVLVCCLCAYAVQSIVPRVS